MQSFQMPLIRLCYANGDKAKTAIFRAKIWVVFDQRASFFAAVDNSTFLTRNQYLQSWQSAYMTLFNRLEYDGCHNDSANFKKSDVGL